VFVDVPCRAADWHWTGGSVGGGLGRVVCRADVADVRCGVPEGSEGGAVGARTAEECHGRVRRPSLARDTRQRLEKYAARGFAVRGRSFGDTNVFSSPTTTSLVNCSTRPLSIRHRRGDRRGGTPGPDHRGRFRACAAGTSHRDRGYGVGVTPDSNERPAHRDRYEYRHR
jgi:hypothetical protein